MPTYGPKNGATFASAGVGIAWTSPDNAASSNNVYATVNLTLDGNTKYLRATNFGFSVPAGEAILGITTEWEFKTTVIETISTFSSRVVQAGVEAGTDLSDGVFWPTTDTYTTYGSSSELWGLTWTPAQVNASDFGASLQATGSLTVASIDHVRITVTTAFAKYSSALMMGV